MKNYIYSLIILSLLVFVPVSYAQNATDSGRSEDLNDQVDQRLEDAKNKPKAFIGTITDKTDDTMQLKDLKGEIQLISIDSQSAGFVKLGDTSSDINFSDIAIGDFIAALGYLDGNTVLTSTRVLVTNPPEENGRKIIFGNIKEIERSEVIITDKEGTDWSLDFPRRWQGPDIDELEPAMNLIAIGVQNANTINIRTIHIVSSDKTDN